jgi:molybdopterin molybdotransferase
LDDVFIALDNICKNLPKKRYLSKKIKNIDNKDIIKSPLIVPNNIPPNNQSSMDGIGVKSKKKSYKLKGKTHLNKINKIKIFDNECLLVKTGCLIPDYIKYIIPVENIFKNKNNYHILNHNFKNNYIRIKGHIFKKNQKINLDSDYLLFREMMALKSLNRLKCKVQSKLSFKIISTGSEFTSNHFINPTNSEYLENIINKFGQIVDSNVHIIDDQKIITKEINKSNSDITIIIGGTGKSDDDIKFNKFKLQIDGLDLKPGRPFKFFSKLKKIYLFFPGNPCSSFVLTNILIKSLINKYCFNDYKLESMTVYINDINYNFSKLTRKTFLFGVLKNNKIKILKNQESSNLSNLLISNCLIYYDKTKVIKLYKIND